ncbi:hypothetical protein WMQ60_16150 [Vibrio diabolicus]
MPATVYGGTELLFTLVANHLSKLNSVDVYCKNESVLKKMPINKKVNIIGSKKDLRKNVSYDVLIVSSKDILEVYSVALRFKSFLIWQLQPDELCAPIFKYINRVRNFGLGIDGFAKFLMKIFYSKRQKALKDFVIKTSNKKQFYFMDRSNFLTTQKWLSNELGECNYLPILTDNVGVRDFSNNDYTVKDHLVVSIVSRISYDFKFYPILSSIEGLLRYNKPLRINIVGDGEALQELKSRIEKIAYNKQMIEIVYHGFLEKKYVREEILPKTDLFVGMGTAVLDAAALSIPTIVSNVHACYIESESMRYEWLFNKEGYSVGEYINKNSRQKGITMLDALSEIEQDYLRLSKKSLEYVNKNHTIDTFSRVFNDFINNINNKYDDDFFYKEIKRINDLDSNKLVFLEFVMSILRKFKSTAYIFDKCR